MVYGWGLEGNSKYWLVQNTYGPTWGEDGSIRVSRGKNNLGLESLCYSAKPINTWSKDIRNNTLPSASKLNTFVENKGDPLPLSLKLTPSLSQLTPNYCDASWAFAVIHALADS